MIDKMLGFGFRSVEGYFTWLKGISVQLAMVDRAMIDLAQQGPMPPFHLRVRVHGSPDLAGFLAVGERCASDLATALERVDRPLAAFADILDFGCGCGRTLRWMHQLAPQARLYGSDIDAEAVDWTAKNMPFAMLAANGERDPLSYPANAFDLIYAVSVFTHMTEELQDFWLKELHRVLRPGGVALVTLHGYEHWQHFSPQDQKQLQEKGMMVVPTAMWYGLFPDWYHNSYHAQDYVMNKFGSIFNVIDYQPVALDNNHDIVVLGKPA
ncbi:MAG: methyltransferase domain-containing protein [Alphaproteobacteria bacterium]|jgi:SAM-dependent methyltransferase|nr:methyltransferase domain-containing protein [Alphaproteobacteria bacterium]